MGLVRGPAHQYRLGRCSTLLVCVRRSRQDTRPAPVVLLISPYPPLLPQPRVPRSACGGLPSPGVTCPRLLVRHSSWSVRSASSVRLLFCCPPHACCFFLNSRSCGACAPPPCIFVPALREVPAQGAGRAVPCGPCPPPAFFTRLPCSASLVCVWGGGVAGSLCLLSWFSVDCTARRSACCCGSRIARPGQPRVRVWPCSWSKAPNPSGEGGDRAIAFPAAPCFGGGGRFLLMSRWGGRHGGWGPEGLRWRPVVRCRVASCCSWGGWLVRGSALPARAPRRWLLLRGHGGCLLRCAKILF